MREVKTKQEATAYVKDLKKFYKQLTTYVIVNIVLLIVNLVTNPHQLWFYWVTLFWGIGIAMYTIKLFGPARKLNKTWEEKKIKEYMNKK